MERVIKLRTSREYYSIKECAEHSLSVAEVIDILSYLPKDAKVVFSNDNGYTFGAVNDDTIKSVRIK